MESIFKLGILLSVVDRISGPAGRMGRSMDTLRAKTTALGPAFDRFRTYGLRVAAAGAVMIALLGGTVTATAQTQKALGELSSVGITDMAALESAGARFSGTWAGTTKAQFIGAAYDIKSGISSLTDTGVAEFTRLAALTGKATKSTTAEMTSLFASGYGIYKQQYERLTDLQFGELFSAGIAGAVKNFKTTGSGMARAISTLGATATTAKVPLHEQLTILGMLQATMSGSEAGTKYRAVMQSAATAGQKLKLSFTDANNQLLSMPEILTELRGRYGDTLDAIEKMQIQKAFGTQEAVAVIDLLYGSVGKLKGNIQDLSAVMGQGTVFTEQMAAAMNRDIGAGISLLAQRWHNLVEVIGKQFIPILTPVFAGIGNVVNAMTRFAEKHPVLTRAAVLTAGGLSLLLFVAGGLATTLGVVGMMGPSVATGFTLAGTAAGWLRVRLLSALAATRSWIVWQKAALLHALYFHGGVLGLSRSLATSFLTSMGAAIASVWSFTVALLANPITWIVIGIVALGVALVVLYRKFEAVRTAVDGFLYVLGYIAGTAVRVGKGFLTALMHPILFVQALFWGAGEVIGWIVEKFNGLSPALKTVAKLLLSFAFPPLAIFLNWDAIKKGLSAALSWIRGLFPRFLDAGKGLWNALTEGLRSVISMPVEIVKKGLSKVRNLLPFSDAKEGPLSRLTLSGARIMETLGAGVKASAPALKKAVAGSLASAMIAMPAIAAPAIPDISARAVWQTLEPRLPAIPDLSADAPAKPKIGTIGLRDDRAASSGNAPYTKKIEVHIHNITLPNVTRARTFIEELESIVEGHDV